MVGPNAAAAIAAKTKRDPQLLLGVLFCSDDRSGEPYHQRSYERRKNNFRSRNVEDIRESFIEGPLVQAEYKFNDDKLFPTDGGREAVAIYVCRGARLALLDDSLYLWNETKKTLDDGSYDLDAAGNKISKQKHTRSLFQQGSLVVVSDCKLRLAMQAYIGNIEESNQYAHYWMDRGTQNAILPDIYKEADALFKLDKKVLFIGANDSMHNSICWRLRVTRDTSKTHQHKYLATLEAPEGGRLLDVANWNQGFNQIFWRHKSERFPDTAIILGGNKKIMSLPFQLPGDAMLKRILGIENANAMNVPFPTPVPERCTPLPTNHWDIQYDPSKSVSEQTDCDVRRYIDYSRYSSVEMPSVVAGHWGKGCDKWTFVVDRNSINNPLPPLPFYPPTYEMNNGQMDNVQYFVKKGNYVLAEKKGQDIYCHIGWPLKPNEGPIQPNHDGHQYRLVCKTMDEFKWQFAGTGYFGMDTLSETNRLGTDFFNYRRVRNSPVFGKVQMWCLEKQKI